MRLSFKKDELVLIREYLGRGTLPASLTRMQQSNFITKARRCELKEDGTTLIAQERGIAKIIVADDDSARIREILVAEHALFHPGVKVLWKTVTEKYIGFKRLHVENFVQSCDSCQRFLPGRRNQDIRPLVVRNNWERIQVDCIDMRRFADANDGYSWILTVIDCKSKFLFAEKMKNKSAESVIAILRTLFLLEGAPSIIHTDNGREFVNATLRALCEEYRVRHVRGLPRCPNMQGQVERVNQTLARALAKSMHDKHNNTWIDVIEKITGRYNLAWKRSTNRSPMLLFRGRVGYNHELADAEDFDYDLVEESLPLAMEESDDDVASPGMSLLEQAELDAYRQRYQTRMIEDASANYKRLGFEVDNLVLIKKVFDNNSGTRKEKNTPFYEEGIWKVISSNGPNSYCLKNTVTEVRRTVDKAFLKKYYPRLELADPSTHTENRN
jgi:transposase InsO family protein